MEMEYEKMKPLSFVEFQGFYGANLYRWMVLSLWESAVVYLYLRERKAL